MRTTSILIALVAVTLLPTAAAHVTVVATPPTGPFAPFQPTAVAVELSALCPVVVAEYQAMQHTELQLAVVSPDPPTWLNQTGDVVPFTVEQCGTDGYARTTGNVYITPSPRAPAFQDTPIQVGAQGETNEGGDFVLQVGYYANLTAPEQALVAGSSTKIILDLAANADTTLQIEHVEDDHGHGIEAVFPGEVKVDSPLLAGSATRRVEFDVQVPANHSGNLILTIMPVATGNVSASGESFTLTIPVSLPAGNETEGHGEDGHDHDDEAGKDAPLPGLVALGAVGLAAVALRRKQDL